MKWARWDTHFDVPDDEDWGRKERKGQGSKEGGVGYIRACNEGGMGRNKCIVAEILAVFFRTMSSLRSTTTVSLSRSMKALSHIAAR